MSRYPFPETFTGWYRVAGSDEIAGGKVRPLTAFGRELVAFRGEDGRARIFDAHCPHLGAHLGYGGVVVGNGLRCPFHGWCFDGGGACASIPYAQKIPPRAQVRTWEVREIAGRVLAWFDEADRPPAWEPPAAPEEGSPDWDGPVRHRRTARTHVLEVGENLVDPAHFRVLHGVPTVPVTETAADGHAFRAWTHLAQVTPRGEALTRIETEGSGIGLWRVRFLGIVETVVLLDLTPLGDGVVAFHLDFYISREGGALASRGVGSSMINEIMFQLDQDIPIWEHKIYRAEPLLCAGEGGIPALRRWARAYYSSSTP